MGAARSLALYPGTPSLLSWGMLAHSRHPKVAAIATAVTAAAMRKDLGRRSQSARGRLMRPVTAAVRAICAVENLPESTIATTMPEGAYGRRGLRPALQGSPKRQPQALGCADVERVVGQQRSDRSKHRLALRQLVMGPLLSGTNADSR